MDFALTEPQETIRRLAADFAAREVAPIAAAIDREERFPADVVRKLGELGFMGMNVAPEHGGAGLDTVSYAVALAEISRACASTGVIMSVNNSLVCWPLEAYGNDEQKRRVLAPLARGERLGAFCLSEPNAGTDAANQQTRAARDGDHWVLNGLKNFITNGANADTLIVFAMVDPAQKHKGIAAFIVDTGTPGFAVIAKEKKMGIRASDTAQLAFDNVRVPAANLLGQPGDGFRIAMSTLDGGRIGIAAQALGIGLAAYDAAVAYAKQREQFGRPIASFQAIQWKIAEMRTRLEAARLLTLRAAWLKDRKQRHTEESAIAKLYASETAGFVVNEAVQVFGGNGYSKEFPVERHFRDAKICEIYEGTSEAQRMVIAASQLK